MRCAMVYIWFKKHQYYDRLRSPQEIKEFIEELEKEIEENEAKLAAE